MKPTPLTDEQLMSLGYNSGDPDGLLEFAKNVVSARDAQWGQMLAGQEPVAKIVARQYEDGTPAGNTIEWRGRNAENDLPVGTKLYAAPQPAQPKAEPLGWLFDRAIYPEGDLRGRQWKHNIFSTDRPYMENGMIRNLRRVYTETPPRAEQHPNARSAFVSAIRCGLAKSEDWPAYEQGYSQGRYDADKGDI